MSLTVDALDADPVFAWPTMDNLRVGQFIPEPASASVLGLAGLALLARRSRSA